MANWAIVIGIDQYWKHHACLKGAVRDALRMREWLNDVDGGGVPKYNLSLLLSPSPSSDVPPGLQYLDATRGRIIEAIDRLVKQSGGKGERLFFHYSGHGLTSRFNFHDENAIVPGDFNELLTDNSLSVQSILDYFAATEFQDQFFFIDACRNIPWETEIRIGAVPPRVRDPGLPAIQQFVCYATSPGVKAIEIREAGNERGAFTEALLEGLRGAGAAKAWDVELDQYVVRWDRLFNYVRDRVTAQKLRVNDDTVARLWQVPRKGGEQGAIDRDSNPVLIRFPDRAFGEVPLNVYVEPSVIVARAEVNVYDPGDPQPIRRQSKIAGLPISFPLPPRSYTVCAAAAGHRSTRKSWLVELYEPKNVTVSLQPAPIEGRPAFPPEPSPGEVEPGSRALSAPEAQAALRLRCADPMATLELADDTGKVLHRGTSPFFQVWLKPGLYHARLRTPEGQIVEKPVELLPGQNEELELVGPALPESRLERDVIASADFTVHADNTLEVSEEVGPITSPHLSTILTLAGSAATSRRFNGPRLRTLGVSSLVETFPAALSGLQVLFAIDTVSPGDAAAYLASVKVRMWDQAEPVPVVFDMPRPSHLAGLGEVLRPVAPGSYWLGLELPERQPVVFAVTVLPHRLTLLVMQRDVNGQMRIFQYLPDLGDLDGSSYPTSMRHLELLERSYTSGQLDYTYESARDLLYGKWADPLAGCLGGYLLLRLGQPERIRSE
ncbi:MAG: caspase family protein, partial [Chloroflexi bacterium]|nr:caspase family protein [Chloroflexota bacterium]